MQRLFRSLRYAFRGLGFLVRSQPNARIHLAATVAVVALGAWLQVALTDWALLTLAITGVWAMEALNTGLEQLADRTAPEQHPLVRNAKDVAAAGVLLASLGAVVVGLLVLGLPLWNQLFA